MKKFLLIIAVIAGLLLIIWEGLLATGMVSRNSLAMVLNVAIGRSGGAADEQTARRTLVLPPGFSMSIYARDLPRARLLRFTRRGDLLVSRPHAGDIVLLAPDRDGDGKADARRTLIAGLDRPHGMDFAGDWLYIAERDGVGRITFDHDSGETVGDYQIVVSDLTSNGFHWSKTLRVGPDEKLYLTQGSSCNACVESDPRRATMMRFELDGSGGEILATGLRNSVGFDWSPWDGGLYATDNGRDLLGDDFPPCELNRIEPGHFYGWPYFNGANVEDPALGPDPLAAQRSPTPPVHNFRAHNAPLGIAFVDTSDWPGDYDRVALVALHGSWNRSTPDGYKVVSLHFSATGIEERPFLDGFNREGEILGRPVDIAQGPDGALYISDDYASAIYRIAATQGSPGTVSIDPPAKSAPASGNTEWLASADLQAMATAGAALYHRYKCRSCHEGGDNRRSLTKLGSRLDHAGVIEVLRAPRPPMPLLDLTEQERRELAVYLLAANP